MKWILHSNVEQKRLWGKWTEWTTPKEVMLYLWWDWKESSLNELLLENQTINSNKYCSQLDQLKAVFDEKHPELVNRKPLIFIG